MQDLWLKLVELVELLVQIVGSVGLLALSGALVLTWLAWSLFGINWPKAFRTLREGAWVPFVLLIIATAIVWSQLAPANARVFGFLLIGNFWWQLGAVALGACAMFFCGWLQVLYGWTPIELNLEPAAHGHGHDHAHGHDHGHGHAAHAPAHGHHEPAHH